MDKQFKRLNSILAICNALIIGGLFLIRMNQTIIQKQNKSIQKEIANQSIRIETLNNKLMRQFDIVRKNSFHFVINTLIRKCVEKKIPVNVALSLIQIESNFDPNAISYTGDHGLFQFNLRIWKDALKIDESKLYEPEYNIEVGLTILGKCYEQAGNWGLAVAIYNRGSNHAESKHPEKLANSIFKE